MKQAFQIIIKNNSLNLYKPTKHENTGKCITELCLFNVESIYMLFNPSV